MLGRRDLGWPQTFNYLRQTPRTLACFLNLSKCEIACHDIRMTIDDQASHDFTNISFEKMTLLGAPLVPGPAVDMVLQSKANDLERAIRRLSIHDALVLLRNSLSVPKLIYSMRTAVCVDCPSLARFDDLLREGLPERGL